ncbi:hypothetical protein [Cloacibacterium sp. TD35]|uniref:hypothetical protein n=1 Tax=Cloacibacterium sp. TD35 TaxID=2976818 RepID=UPI00237D9E35|nr:hypothetical protein [Cloacibacterium sp. TD35]WDT67297.1 hypothetical protein N7277_08115 [Cloacibacterium sp. TD35]
MSITNLNNTHLTAQQITDAQNALTQLEAALQIINVNLSAEDRQKYGSINEQNKLFVNKVYDFHKSQPDLSSSDVDWEEFENDHNSRKNLEAFITRLDSLSTKLKNAKILHDYVNYQAALTDYAYTNYKAGTASPGFETKLNETKQFFGETSKTIETPPTE